MAKGVDVSVVIPSRNEEYLGKTVEDILKKAKGNIEVIPVLDGYWPKPKIVEDPRVTLIHHGTPRGMRASINAGVELANGKFILKSDAHCMYMEGFDIELKSYIEDNWVVIPRRKRLDAKNWQIEKVNKPDVDYEYLSYPNQDGNWESGLHGRIWNERIEERKNVFIDENMSAQGSCWFMHKSYFHKLELEDELNYGTFANEFQEIGLKCWLSGGKVVTNKKVWYAHFHKTKGRGYSLERSQIEKAKSYTKRWLTNTAWHKQTLSFAWLIEKFWPVPGWPEDRSLWTP